MQFVCQPHPQDKIHRLDLKSGSGSGQRCKANFCSSKIRVESDLILKVWREKLTGFDNDNHGSSIHRIRASNRDGR